MEHLKTKNLSVAEYFLVIQKEYLIAEFRKKIYFSPKDKRYYQRVMNFKSEKIKDISKRNRLDSIFNNESKMNEVREELFDKLGNPRFEMTPLDLENYYATGNEFSYRGGVWILDQICENGHLTLYSPKLERYEDATKEEVCRIL